MHTIKIRRGFDLYHHAVYGYYPSWDEIQYQYTAKVTNEKWLLWTEFFLLQEQGALEEISPNQMMALYGLDRYSDGVEGLDQRNLSSNWQTRRPMDNPL